jgi:hypothetical protein
MLLNTLYLLARVVLIPLKLLLIIELLTYLLER